MAVSVPNSFSSKQGMWHLGEPPNTFPSPGTNAVTTSMAYQYPLPASSNFETSNNLIPSYHHPPSDHHQPQAIAPGPPTPTGSKNSGPSAAPKAAKIKKSMSTPNVRGQATAEAAALALSADKRRNKLGYHRTSVACGHCRRRKIRCIPAPADAQGRCSNCIRLKKECAFYSVDQQPQPDLRRRGSKSQSGTGRASESTSPTTSSGQLPDGPSNMPYPPLNMPPIQDLGGPQMKRQRTESFSPESKGGKPLTPGLNNFPEKVAIVTSSRNFDYNHSGPTNWMAPDASPGLKQQGQSDVPPAFWSQNSTRDSPLTPAFSPFTPNLHIPPPQSWPTQHTEPSPREDIAWSVPQRSISYSNLEGLHGQQPQHQYTPSYTQSPSSSVPDNHYTTKPRQHPGMYPPPSTQTTNSMMVPTSATSSEPSPHPHSASSLPPSSFSSWQQPHYQPKPIGSNSESYSYPHHDSLPRPNSISQYPGEAHHPTTAAPPPAPTYYQEQGYYHGPPHPHSGYDGHPGR